jgi:hypothetical protein
MSALVLVEAIGDIEIDIDETATEETVLRLPLTVQRRRRVCSATSKARNNSTLGISISRSPPEASRFWRSVGRFATGADTLN